jgi:hypothetical protein
MVSIWSFGRSLFLEAPLIRQADGELKNQVGTGKNIQLVLNSIFSYFIKLDISNWRIGKIEFR